MEDHGGLAEEKVVLDPWHQSCREGDISKIGEFLSSDPGLLLQKCPFGLTALHYAVQGNHVAAVDLIISHGIDSINITDNNGQTSLHFAAQSGAVDLILLLIDNGAKVNIKDTKGRAPLDVAITYKREKAVATFLRFNAAFYDYESFLSAVAWGDIKIIKDMSCYVSDVNLPNAKGQTAMHVASDSGDCVVTELLIDIGAKLDLANLVGRTPLHFACSKGNIEMVVLLINRGGNVKTSDHFGLTPLHLACVKGHHAIVKYLISRGADVNALTYSGLSPLYYATFIDHEGIVSTLLEAGALHSILSMDGIAPLNMALISASLNTIDVLLNSGALPNYSANLHPLHIAAALGLNSAISKFLSIQGVLIDNKDSSGKTPLFLAAQQGHSKTLDVLLMNGAKVDLVCSELERTALHSAAENGHIMCVKKLLLTGADPNHQDKSGLSPLHLSVIKGNAEVVEVLAKTNGTVNVKGHSGNSALHLAVENHQFSIFKILINCGGDISATNDEGNGVLHLAAKNGSLDFVKWLINNCNCDPNCFNNDNCSPLHLACDEEHVETAKVLSVNQSLINLMNANGKTPLLLAAEKGHTEILENLLKNGAKIDIVCSQLYRSALHFAAENGQITCVEKLLVAGANPNHQDKSGFTPLHLSVIKGQSKVVDMLAKDNNMVNSKGPLGNSAVHIAVYNNQFQILEMLITHGGDINATNDEGNGVLHIAAKKGYLSIVEKLVNDYKVDPNILNSSKWSPLHLACLDGHTDVVHFLSKMCHVDSAFHHTKFTPLHLAVQWGHTGCVKALLANGANIYLETSVNKTALHLAVLHNNSAKALEIMQCFISIIVSRNSIPDFTSKIDKSVTLKDSDKGFIRKKTFQRGQTVICIAAEKGYLEIVKLLVEIDKNVLNADNGFENALHAASVTGQDNVVDFLSQIIDINKVTYENMAALDLAVLGGHLKCVELLLKRNAKFGTFSKISLKVAEIENTDLALRVLKCYRSCLSHNYVDDNKKYELLNQYISIHGSVYGGTLLHTAARNNNLNCMRLLIEHRCNPEIHDSNGQTVLHIAAYNGYSEIIDYLLNECKVRIDVITSKPSDKNTAFHYAVKRKHFKCVELLLKKNPELHLQDSSGKTPIQLAVDHLVDSHNEICIKTIVSKMEEIHNSDSGFVDDFSSALIMKGPNSDSPLHQVVSYGVLRILELLSPYIKDVIVKDSTGDTPLHRAVRLHDLDMVTLLVKKQRNSLYEKNSEGKTPIDLALRNIRTFLQEELNKDNDKK